MNLHKPPHLPERRKDRYAKWILLAVVSVIATVFIVFTAIMARRMMGQYQAIQTDSTPLYTHPPVTTPVQTTPADTTDPVSTTPAQTTPAQTTPADTNLQGFPNWIEQRLLTNEDARPGTPMPATDVQYIVVHYTGNPGSTAINNRNYFNNPNANVYGSSSHFIVGLDGEIIQCIPTDEVAYANYPMNFSTISIEVCHPDATGEYNEATYASLIRLIAWLCGEYHFDESNVIRHYDVHRLSGYTHEQSKKCPLYYVENEDAWQQLLADVAEALK